jgi:predicted ester cyclase
MDAVETNRRVVREFTRVFKNQHNVDGIDHLFAPGFAHHFAAPVPPGLEGFKVVGRTMNTAFPDVVVTEEDLIVTPDTVIERSSAKATNAGPYRDRPATGKPCHWTEIHIYRLREGRIVAHWAEFDQLGLLTQIGAIMPA